MNLFPGLFPECAYAIHFCYEIRYMLLWVLNEIRSVHLFKIMKVNHKTCLFTYYFPSTILLQSFGLFIFH